MYYERDTLTSQYNITLEESTCYQNKIISISIVGGIFSPK